MNPMKARAETLLSIRSPRDVLMWLSNPILFFNVTRAREGKRPYWARWHSLMLYGERPGRWNSYALFVEGQDFPRIVMKRPVRTMTSYGIDTGWMWGIIYYNQPERMFMHAYMDNANFGTGFDFEGREAFAYNKNPAMKTKIIKECREELERNRGIFWNAWIVRFYISALDRMLEDYSISQ